MTDAVLEQLLFPKSANAASAERKKPNFAYIRKELLKNGVNKKLLWTEYLEYSRLSGDNPLMYSQFCYYIQQDEQKRRATMHINRKPGEQVEVDWVGDPAYIIDPNTGEIINAYLFVGVMTYSQYPYVEVFIDEKQAAGTRSSATKNCHFWLRYLLPLMNWQNGNDPPFSSIITYLWMKYYTPFHMNTSRERLMYGLPEPR